MSESFLNLIPAMIGLFVAGFAVAVLVEQIRVKRRSRDTHESVNARIAKMVNEEYDRQTKALIEELKKPEKGE